MLNARSAEWLFVGQITMADLYWSVEQLCMKNMAVESFWINGAKPAVAVFVEKTQTIPAIRSAVTEWRDALF